MQQLNYLRDKLAFLTVEVAPIFLRSLGNYEHDKLIVTLGGARRIQAQHLAEHFNGPVPVSKLKPVYFQGGPQGSKLYKGNYLTFLVDRAMYVMCEKGKAHVDAVIEYCKGFVAVKTPLRLTNEQIHNLHYALLGTDDRVEIGLWSIGVDPSGYDLDFIEDDLLEFGMVQCERCDRWLPDDQFDVEAFTCNDCCTVEIGV
jgi:hypothetical protein